MTIISRFSPPVPAITAQTIPQKQAGKDREDRVQGVIDRFAFDENGLEIALRLDPQAPSHGLLGLLGEHRLALVG